MRVKRWSFIILSTLFLSFSFVDVNTSHFTKAETIERVPEKMDPWTIIEYVKDNKYVVVKKGTAIAEGAELPESEIRDRFLPLGKKGVVVEYGFNGRPTIIKGVKRGEEHPGRPIFLAAPIV